MPYLSHGHCLHFNNLWTDFDKTPMVGGVHEKSSAAPAAMILLLLLSPLPFLILGCSFSVDSTAATAEVAAVFVANASAAEHSCAAQVHSADLLNSVWTRETQHSEKYKLHYLENGLTEMDILFAHTWSIKISVLAAKIMNCSRTVSEVMHFLFFRIATFSR